MFEQFDVLLVVGLGICVICLTGIILALQIVRKALHSDDVTSGQDKSSE
jgi:hypothetical protein